MLLGTLKALIYVRFSTYMWTLTLQYVDTYLARFFQYVDTYLANTDKKNIVHKTAFTLQRFVCLGLIY